MGPNSLPKAMRETTIGRQSDPSSLAPEMSVGVIVGPAIFDRHVAGLDIAGFPETFMECHHPARLRQTTFEISDHRHRALLRTRRERLCMGAVYACADVGSEIAPLGKSRQIPAISLGSFNSAVSDTGGEVRNLRQYGKGQGARRRPCNEMIGAG